MERIRKELLELKARLAEIQQARGAAQGSEQALLLEEETGFKHACTQLKNGLGQSQQRLQTDSLAQRARLEARWKRHASRVESAFTRLKARVDNQSNARLEAFEALQRETHAQAILECDQKVAVLRKECSNPLSRLAALKAATEKLQERIGNFAKGKGVQPDKSPNKFPEGIPADFPASDEGAIEEIGLRLAETEQLLDSSRKKLKRMPAILAYALVLLLHAGAFFCVDTLIPHSPYVFAVLVSFVIVFALVQSLYLSTGEKAHFAVSTLLQQASVVCAMIERQTKLVHERMQQGNIDLDAEKIQRLCVEDEKLKRQVQESRKAKNEAKSNLQVRRDNLIGRITRGKTAALNRLDLEPAANAAALQAKYNQELERRTWQHAVRIRQIQEELKNSIERLASDWGSALSKFRAFGVNLMSECRAGNPPWSELSASTAQSNRLPTQFAEKVFAGSINVNLQEFIPDCDTEGAFSIPAPATIVLPLVLSYPLRGSLFIRAGAKKREEGLRILFGTVLRMLCSFPPAKAKLTIVDPVGLGQNFAALMHLSDYDESLVGGKIWSESAHIERKLSELTEHMEKVIQKYLRNRYNAIDEFNREAGQMAEPYRFLVIADFPTGFSEMALERLASIVSSGVRCGVYTLILHDEWQKLPGSLAELQLKRNGLVVAERDNRFILDDATLYNCPFAADAPPSAALLDALIHSIGKQCQEAARVQVPFDAVAPKPGEYWSSSSESGIRLPLGKAGADRLQYLHLGKGTAQHAMIAGKTGSGKSNLFHVILTNAAMWYSPRELEFYLIDLKKGVEFKTYGVHRLPHARVVAIESDREFALSVLRRIDQELSLRGELFRGAGVQDFPSFRQRQEKILPRTLLIIDEFQEFFTDDDAVAQDAALLLDRLVRQGRAFGIHVILGSQTLGGVYTLAKSTLGQVAVRIALQCNEADSYLILNDDNPAAALLSRPGEAIYNDQSGMVEGNNPFQTVYLAKDVHDILLRQIQQKAIDEGLNAVGPQTLFEGSSLADLRNNSLLRDLISRDATQADSLSSRIWLGEANAIKGPTEANFLRQAGSNLLIVGQRGDGGLAMCSAAVMCLAAGDTSKLSRILILDGTNSDPGTKASLALLMEALPGQIEIVEYRRVPEVIEELAKKTKNRQDGNGAENGDNGGQIYLLVLGLEKFRALRQDDEYGFSGDSGESSPPKNFASVLSEGPREGIHSIVWCDTLSNLNRTLNRKMLREFEMRVLFQMSSTDSSELIDSPAANRLGLYNALFFTAQNGAIEKFRPYASPGPNLIKEFSRGAKS